MISLRVSATNLANNHELIIRQRGFSERKIRRNEIYTLLCVGFYVSLLFSFI